MKLKKILLYIVGVVSLTLGTIGIILPVLPTTPFMLLAAGCFSVSSPRLLLLIQRNKFLGSYISNYQDKTGIPKNVKIRAIVFLWSGLIISALLSQKLLIIIILFTIGSAVTIHLVRMKTRE